MERLIKVWMVGKLDYAKALNLQKHLASLHQNSTQHLCNTLLCVEHSPVYTTGIRTQQYTDIEVEKLKEKGAEFYRTNRGGLITFHGPGQLVAYPIINLKYFKPSIKWYVASIERTIIDLCHKFHLKGETSPYTGVWIDDKKVCAIGVHGSRFVVTHGLALNCNTDLRWFEHIVPCGIRDKGVTSLSNELGRIVTVEETLPMFLDSFERVFDCSFMDFPQNEATSILESI